MNEKTLASLIEIKKSFKILEQVKRSNNPLIHALNSMVAVIKDTSKKLFFFKFPNEDFDASVCFFNFFFYWAFLKKHTPLLEWKISLLEKSWKNKRTSGTNIFKQSKSLREKCLYSGPHFPIFGLNSERYSVRTQSECWKLRTRITLNTNTFYVASVDPFHTTDPSLTPLKISEY